MPLQLIYTSAPRGVVAGRSGYCTVARSSALREAVMLQLEKWSHYQHLSLSGGQERPIHCCRIIDVRGARYHVLSRIQDAGLDFTGRTNFVAHHLVFTPEEIREFPSPAVILRDWSGWAKSWSREPQILDTEDWSSLKEPRQIGLLPADRWQRLTGDFVNGYGLLDCRSGIVLRVDGVSAEDVLGLMAESLELLELRDPSHDFRATGWQYTFTTSLQEQDSPSDFRWRCFHSDNPASARFTGQDCRALLDIRPIRVTEGEASLARLGRQPPRFIEQPKKTQCFSAETARFRVVAEGVPPPTYQWFLVDRNNNGTEIPGAIESELLISSAPLGVSRYVVRISNSAGEETSEVAELSSERRPVAPAQPGHERPVQVVRDPIAPRGLAGDRGIEESHRIQPSVPTRTADEIARNRARIESQVQGKKEVKKYINSIIVIVIIFVSIATGVLISIENKWESSDISVQIAESKQLSYGVDLVLADKGVYVKKEGGKKEGGEFKVKEGDKITFQVNSELENFPSDYTFKWYHGAGNLEIDKHNWTLTNAPEAKSGHYRVLITKGFKTKEIKFKLTVTNENVSPVGSNANESKVNPTALVETQTDNLASSFGQENRGENNVNEIPDWRHISTGEANKGVKVYEPTLKKWLVSDYETSGIDKGEWVFIYRIAPINNMEKKIFEMSFNLKDLNESEVGLMFRKGDKIYFHGLAGTNFVTFRLPEPSHFDLDDKKNESSLNIRPGITNLTLQFYVAVQESVLNGKTSATLNVTCWVPEVGFEKKCEALSDYGNQNWQIGYAFARGKSPKESKALAVYINPN